MEKTCLIYYSLTKQTKKAVEFIRTLKPLDVYEIEPEKEISKKGFFKYVWGGGQVMMKQKPKIKPLKINLDDYDNIIFATPIWAWTYSPPIRSFLSLYPFSNKNVYYLYTHEGGNKGVVEKFKNKISKNNRFIDDLGLNYHKESKEENEKLIHKWLQKHPNL